MPILGIHLFENRFQILSLQGPNYPSLILNKHQKNASMNLLQSTMNYRGRVTAAKNVPVRSPLQLQHNATYCII